MSWTQTFKYLSTYASALLVASILNLIVRAIFPPFEDYRKGTAGELAELFGKVFDTDRVPAGCVRQYAGRKRTRSHERADRLPHRNLDLQCACSCPI